MDKVLDLTNQSTQYPVPAFTSTSSEETSLLSFLKEINANSEDMELLKQWAIWEAQATQSQHLQKTLIEIVQKSKSLPENGFVLIPGGTKDNLFNEMLHLLTKKRDGTYDFYVIHVGHGVKYHHTLHIKKNEALLKTKKLIARCYTAIPQEELFYGKNDADFFKHLLAFLSFPRDHFKPKYIYEGVLKSLAKYHNDSSLIERSGAEEALFVTPLEQSSFPLKLIYCFIRLKSVLTNQPQESWMHLIERKKQEYLKSLLAIESSLQYNDRALGDEIKLIRSKIYETVRKISYKMWKTGGPFCDDPTWFVILSKAHRILQMPTPPSTQLPLDKYSSMKEADHVHSKNNPLVNRVPNPIAQRRTHFPRPFTSSFAPPPSFDWEKYEMDQAIQNCLDMIEMPFYPNRYAMYEIDRFALRLPLNQQYWTNSKHFNPLCTLLSEYLYSLELNCEKGTVIVSSHRFLTILTLYYVASATFVHTYNELHAAFFEEENLKKAQTLIQRVAPPNDLFNMLDYDLFLMITNPEEQKRFNEIKKAYQNWTVPSDLGTAMRPLNEKRFLMQYVPPQPQGDGEFAFYRAFADLLNEKGKAHFFKPKINKKDEEHPLHFTDLIHNYFWKKVLPSFEGLRNLHEFVGALCSYRQVEINPSSKKIWAINNSEGYAPSMLPINIGSFNLGHIKEFISAQFPFKQERHDYLRCAYGLAEKYRIPPPYPWNIILESSPHPKWMDPQLRLVTSVITSIIEKFPFFKGPDLNLPDLLGQIYLLKPTRRTRIIEKTFSEAIGDESGPLETTLRNENQIRNPAFIKDVASFISEPTLAMHHLFSWYRNHLHTLKDPEHRLFFLQQLFKMTPFDSQNVAQLGIAHSPQRCAEAALLFSDGLTLIAFHNQDKPNHTLFLFSSYVLTTLSLYYKECPQELASGLQKQKEQMEEQILLLKSSPQGLTEQEWKQTKQLYHMHLAYHLCIVKANDPNALFFSKKLGHYFAMHCFEKRPDYLFLTEAIHRSIYSLSSQLATLNQEKLVDLVKTTLEIICPDATKEEEWDTYEVHIDRRGTIYGSGNKNEVTLNWQDVIIVVNGKVFNAHSIRITNRIGSLEFPNASYPITTTGKEDYLIHPAGTFKKIDDKILFQPNDQKDWYVFCTKSELPQTILSPFRYGFDHFHNPDRNEWTLVQNGEYDNFGKHFIWTESNNTICHPPYRYTPIPDTDLQELKRIENPDWMYQRTNMRSEESSIILPRYGLAFTKENGMFRCISGKEGFFLVKNTLPKHVVCVQERAIALTDASGHRTLLLIPRFKMAINQPGQFPFELPVSNRSYSCFDVQTTQETILLIPSNLEGTLDLISYRLYESNFDAVHALIESISPAETFTHASFSSLKSLIEYANMHIPIQSDHVLCLLKLTALYFQAKKKANPLYTFENSEELPSLKTHYEFYLRKKKGFSRKKWLSEIEEHWFETLLQTSLPTQLEKIQKKVEKVTALFEWIDKIVVGCVRSLSAFDFCHSNHASDIDSIFPLEDYSPTFNCKNFFSLYAAIESGDWDLKTTQNRLDIKVAIDSSNDYIHLALLCVTAKRQGIELPPLPDKPPHPLYYSLEESQQQKIEQKIENFKTCLKKCLKKVKKEPLSTQSELTNRQITQIEQKAQWTYDADAALQLVDECPYPFNRLSLLGPKEVDEPDVPLPKRPDYVSIDPTAPYEAYLNQKKEELQQELSLGAARFEKEQAQRRIGKIWAENPDIEHILQMGLNDAQRAKEENKQTLLRQVNNHLDIPQNAPLTQAHFARIARLYDPLTISDLENIAQWAEKRDTLFQTACQTCPDLKNPNFQKEVWKKLLAYEIEAVYELIYKQALNSYKKAKQSQNPLEKDLHYAEVARVLTTDFKKLHIQDKISFLQMLIFIRKKGLIPREDQLYDVQSLTQKACILQKIMGGGKTAVIAPPWAFQEAQAQGKLPALFAEASLYQSLVDNLKNSQYQAFGQHVFTICPKSAQLELLEIEQILKNLEDGYATQRVLIMKAESLEMLDLAFQRLNVEPTFENQKKREVLREVMNFFKDKVSVLADEVDLILRADFEVNLPTGQKDRLLPSRIKLTQTIFEHLTLDNQLGIQEGRQSLQTDETLKEIFGRLGQNLLKYSPLKLKNASPDVQAAFCTYLTSHPEDPIPDVLKMHVNTLRQSEQLREGAELIALTRHLVATILPAVFKQTPGLHYGRVRDPRFPGKVVPFVGVDTPSTREFGGPYEWLCKQFLTALIKGIEPVQLKRFIETFIEQSESDIVYNKIEDGQTKSAKDFKKLTGLELQDPEKNGVILTDLLQKTKVDIRLALKIEAQTATEQVGYYGQYYNASSQSIPNLVHSFLGMTGTPAGAPGWNPKVGEVRPDPGAEGKIEFTLLKRERETDVYRIQQDSSSKVSMEDVLKRAKKCPEVFLDMGALFRHQSIEKSARDFLQHVQTNAKSRTKGVLFFHHKEGETSSDRVALGQFVDGKWEIAFLENTREEALRKMGFVPDDCVAFFDQRHTTGTDLPLSISAHAFVTMSESIERRTLLQTVMRLRNFCSTQTADFVLLDSFYDYLNPNTETVTVKRLIEYADIQQAEKDVKAHLRAYEQQIDQVFVEKFRSYIREKDPHSAIVAAYLPFVILKIQDSPYTQFFSENAMQDPLTYLKAYAANRLAVFKENGNTLKKDHQDNEKALNLILENAEKDPTIFPQKVLGKQEQSAQVDRQIEVQQEKEKELSRDIQIQQSCVTYESDLGPKRTLKEWWNLHSAQESVQQFILAIKNRTTHPSNLLSAPEILRKVRYEKRFDTIFQTNILMTDAMQRNHEKWLSIFHPTQKPAQSIVIVKNQEDYLFTIVSQCEAKFLKENLEALNLNDVWLVNALGLSLLENRTADDLLKDAAARQGLIECSLFVGRATTVRSLDREKTYLREWLSQQGDLNEIKKTYLLFRNANHASEEKFADLVEEIEEILEEDSINNLSQEEIKILKDRNKIFLLNKNQIVHLRPEQIPYIHSGLISELTASHLIQAIPPERVTYCKEHQYHHLTPDQLLHLKSKDVISNLPQSIIETLPIEDLLHHHHFIDSLSDRQIDWIKNKAHLDLDSWSHAPSAIKQKLSPLLAPESIPKIREDDVLFLRNSDIKHLKTVEQIHQIPLKKVMLYSHYAQFALMTWMQKMIYLISRLVILYLITQIPKLYIRVQKTMTYIKKARVGYVD